MPDLSALFSSENVIVALIGFASGAVVGAIGSIIAPLVTWHIEKKRLTRSERKEKIQKWRQMVHDVALQVNKIETGEIPRPSNVRSVEAFLLDQHQDFPSLMSVLPESAGYEIFGSMTFHAGRTRPHALIYLDSEISKIEDKWGLK
jgi:hypothetical protein